MAVTGAALFLADLPYHLHPSRRDGLRRGLMLTILLALPFVRFWLGHPSVIRDQLTTRGAAVAEAGVSLGETLGQFGSEYAFGLSPIYWYAPVNGRDDTRHALDGYGNLLPITAPFAVLGLLLALRNLRSPAHRIILLALLATPVGAALVEIGAPRILWFVIPATVLTGLGLSASLEWLERRRVPYPALAVGVAAVLGGFNFYLLRDSLVNGPTWFHDYTLYGMQYGARQVFGQATVEYLESDPQTTVSVSPTWANGAEMLADFFLTEEQERRVVLQSLDYYLAEKRDLDPKLIVVLPPPEYERALAAPLFERVEVDRVLPYPDGTPGFYFVRLTYSELADSFIAEARTAQHELAQGEVMIDGEPAKLEFTQLNGGRVEDIFDGDFESVARTYDINPAVFIITFAAPRPVGGVTVTTGSMDVGLVVRLYTADEPQGEPAAEYSRTYTDLPDDPTVDLAFDQPPPLVTRLYLEILKVGDAPAGTVHVREIVVR
jgi:hypothetical protein